MKTENDPPLTPRDAREVTEGQRELQEKFDQPDNDPDAPAGDQTHHQLADET